MIYMTDDADSSLWTRVLRLEQRLRGLQEFIEDGIADPWDELENTTLPAILGRLERIEDRMASLEAELARARAPGQGDGAIGSQSRQKPEPPQL